MAESKIIYPKYDDADIFDEDYDKDTIKYCYAQAISGNVFAQYQMADYHMNLTKRKIWLHIAANNGCPAAQFHLSIDFQLRDINYTEAHKYLLLCITNTDTSYAEQAYNSLANIYYYGRGVEKNLRTALNYCVESYNRGFKNVSDKDTQFTEMLDNEAVRKLILKDCITHKNFKRKYVDLQKENEQLNKKCRRLQEELDVLPGGIEYQHAINNLESNSGKRHRRSNSM